MAETVRKNETRDSGIAWVGQIPSNWKITRIKAIMKNISIKNHPDEEVLSLYRELGIVPKRSRDDNHNVTSEDTTNYKYVQRGDLVINKMKAWQGSLAVSNYDGIVSPAYYVCQFTDLTVNKTFIHYLLRSKPYAQEYERLSTGMRIGQWDLGIEDFLRIPIILPKPEEQQHLVTFLDRECAKIDEAICAAKASVEDYKNWKSSVIHEAVNKGLNSNVPMKASGIPWIGDIPVHWCISRVKNVLHNLDHLREPISAEKRENKLKLYDYYGASGVIDTIDDYNVDDTVLLIGEDGANLRMRNLPLVYRASGKFWVNNHAHILKPKCGNNYDFLAYALEAGDYNTYITGAAQPKLSQFNLMRFPLVIPPYEEQVQIACFLDEQCAHIDMMISDKLHLIEDLESYKRSLIYEVVTGKRKVV